MKTCGLDLEAQGLFPDRLNQNPACPGLSQGWRPADETQSGAVLCYPYGQTGLARLPVDEGNQSRATAALGAHRSSLWWLLAASHIPVTKTRFGTGLPSGKGGAGGIGSRNPFSCLFPALEHGHCPWQFHRHHNTVSESIPVIIGPRVTSLVPRSDQKL